MTDEPNTPDEPTSDTQSDSSDEEFKRLYNDPELTEEKLQAKLNSYRLAYQQEFEVALSAQNDTDDPTKSEGYLRDFFKKQLPMSAAQIAWLAQNARSESVMLAANKYMVEHALEDSKQDGDPIKAILEALQANDAKDQPANKES